MALVVSDHYNHAHSKTAAVLGIPPVNSSDADIANSFNFTHKVTSTPLQREEALNIPEKIVERSAEYERSICAQVIMATPMMPHFTSELWEGLRGMEYKLTNQEWDKEVLDQSWPRPVDLGHMERKRVSVRVNGKRCTILRISPSENMKELVLLNEDVKRRLNGQRVINVVISKRKKRTEINVISESQLIDSR
uniref:leucine--tRNA ligase n=1 Tax=Ciona savignyi TaxID=51511 RepID=H2YL34_CIOSA